MHKILLPLLALACLGAQPRPGPQETPETADTPKNIILMIGDGMGLAQVSAGLFSNRNSLHLERFPITGIMKTHASNKLVTDSGAGATAFACGCKTYNTAIGVNEKKEPCPTILEYAEKQGLATGLVASSSITHATPASFIAHVESRADMQLIAEYFLKTDIDLFIGGGMRHFNQRIVDTRDLCAELKAKGYEVTSFKDRPLQKISPDPAKPFVWFSADEEPESVGKGRDYLPVAAGMAPEFLKKRSDKGFFLMIEGSQIDWACHNKDGQEAIKEMLDFDAAIGAVLEFAQRDGETLVVVTADHETGGMTIEHGSVMDSLDVNFNSNNHTASLVPVFAFGPGAKRFGGVLDNTDIFLRMQQLFGFSPVRTR
jgi:alkaline phosphatase